MPVALKLCLLYMFYIYIFVNLGHQSLAVLAWLTQSGGRRPEVNVYELTLRAPKVNVYARSLRCYTCKQWLSHIYQPAECYSLTLCVIGMLLS